MTGTVSEISAGDIFLKNGKSHRETFDRPFPTPLTNIVESSSVQSSSKKDSEKLRLTHLIRDRQNEKVEKKKNK